jgi:hypothetical protein
LNDTTQTFDLHLLDYKFKWNDIQTQNYQHIMTYKNTFNSIWLKDVVGINEKN